MVLDANEREIVLDAVEASGLLRNARRAKNATLEGTVTIEKQEVTLRLELDEEFPAKLPRFTLLPWDALGFLPHVFPTGLICFQETEGILLDRRRPLALVRDAISRVLETLSDGVSGRNKMDFVDEFEVYWQRLEGDSVCSLLEPTSESVEVIDVTAAKKLQVVCRDITDLQAYFNGGGNFKYTQQRAFYVPFEPGTFIEPPRHDQPFWSIEKIRELVRESISPSTARWLKKALRGRVRHNETVIFTLPRPSGGAVVFGIRFIGVQDSHPLLEGGSVESVLPLHCDRLDRSYILPRGGAYSDLGQKRVLLVGCGAVGGHLAFECARSGILNLTLVDHDSLSIDNTFRHTLGRGYLGKKKAEALKREIESRLPYVQVTAVPKRVQAGLDGGEVDFSRYDLILFALGTPTEELDLNERLQGLPDAPPAIFTWLEPHGIGGHAVLTNNGAKPGCFECLYTSERDFGNRAAFAALGQHFGKALAGCGGHFTPYSSIDAVRTAALAAQLAIDTLVEKERSNALVSWKGDARAFRDAGFVTSERFEFSEERLSRDRYAYPSSECQVCGEKSSEHD